MNRGARLLNRLTSWHMPEQLSGVGLALGTLFFAASLTPSLIPRTYLTQGLLAGTCFAAGYALGVLWRALWAFMELPEPNRRVRRIANALIGLLCLSVALVFFWEAAAWQNSIRVRMGLEPVTTAQPLKICLTALTTAVAWLALAHLINRKRRYLVGQAYRVVPRKIAIVLGSAAALVLLWLVANHLIFRVALRMLDSSYQQRDALIEPERPQPESWARTGSAGSLIEWGSLGRAGREFVASGPTAQQISAITGRPAQEPIRVYAGIRSAETPKARAELALKELERVHAFERSALVIITPTGTGWIDPASLDSVEYLHHGDIASVAIQYSYLSSPLSLLVQPEYGSAAARALFAVIYPYWLSLPRETRPKLYVHGLSLGAMNSELSIELFDMIEHPIAGALWSGPPFGSRLWRSITDGRNPGSPAWLPRFRDDRFARFMNQDGSTVPGDAPWGPMRVVYLQYASDPVTFFDYRDFYRRPAWLLPPRGPDVSPELRWYPLVTGLQLGLDMLLGTTTLIGYGHVYAPQHYVDAWLAVADIRGWSGDAINALKRHLAEQPQKGSDAARQAYADRGG